MLQVEIGHVVFTKVPEGFNLHLLRRVVQLEEEVVGRPDATLLVGCHDDLGQILHSALDDVVDQVDLASHSVQNRCLVALLFRQAPAGPRRPMQLPSQLEGSHEVSAQRFDKT